MVLDLIKFDKHQYERSASYLHFLFLINQVFHFLEGFEAYRQQMRERAKELGERMKKKSKE